MQVSARQEKVCRHAWEGWKVPAWAGHADTQRGDGSGERERAWPGKRGPKRSSWMTWLTLSLEASGCSCGRKQGGGRRQKGAQGLPQAAKAASAGQARCAAAVTLKQHTAVGNELTSAPRPCSRTCRMRSACGGRGRGQAAAPGVRRIFSCNIHARTYTQQTEHPDKATGRRQRTRINADSPCPLAPP